MSAQLKLTDAWTRRLKTCLEHVLHRPITLDDLGPKRFTFQYGYTNPFALLLQDGPSALSKPDFKLAPGAIEYCDGHATVAVQVKVFSLGEVHEVTETIARKFMFSMLLDTWMKEMRAAHLRSANAFYRTGHADRIPLPSPQSIGTIKEQLDRDLIERGIHVVPFEPGSTRITCTCKADGGVGKEPDMATGGTNSKVPRLTQVQCEHVRVAMPRIMQYLDQSPARILQVRGLPMDDIIGWIHRGYEKLPPAALTAHDVLAAIPSDSKADPRAAFTRGRCHLFSGISPKNSPTDPLHPPDQRDTRTSPLIDSFWSLARIQPDIEPMVDGKYKHTPIVSQDRCAGKPIPARVGSIIDAMYQHVRLVKHSRT